MYVGRDLGQGLKDGRIAGRTYCISVPMFGLSDIISNVSHSRAEREFSAPCILGGDNREYLA